ncbi:hypothetical protein ILUMI_24364 [Ignelater luminosus]|uniref:Uncharacterized protein n=1 Tax=Ignelater luminosus TaxID=2038154 RepID=A0A8K0CC40_IGNLU|nr:hypothetical protein ILUMI_24364 [Ignelater luminosus]
MREYEALGHMSTLDDPVSQDCTFNTLGGTIDVSHLPIYYLSHHPVIRDQALTIKIRVVFDGSAKTTSGISLNETQIVGPIIQGDLLSILVRFRKFEVALIADIEKMYSMIDVNKQLNTVTYGTSSASYLATRCLKFIAERCKSEYPRTSDLLTSTNTIEQMKDLKNDVTRVLKQYGFFLRKFLSNKGELNTDNGQDERSLSIIPLSERSNTKALGLPWDCIQDLLFCQVNSKLSNSSCPGTKRTILSAIAQIYDPLGHIVS